MTETLNTPEVVQAQRILREMIAELVLKKWGVGTFVLKVQNGKIVSVHQSIEQVMRMDDVVKKVYNR